MSRLVETHSARNPRLLLFYGIVGGLLVVLTAGLAYRQLFKTSLYSDRERLQNQRRVIMPGPRGNIYDRDGRVIVGNRTRFSVVLSLAELRAEFRNEYRVVERNFRSLPPAERPTAEQYAMIARASVAQRYLDQVNFILGRQEKVRSAELNRHINHTLLLPYVLLDDLAPEEYARLIERLPVVSPLQVYAAGTRFDPFDAAAAHVLGYTGVDSDPETEDFPGEDLLTFKMKGSIGRTGIELIFDPQLQGRTGGAIYLVDPAGYKLPKPVETRLPTQGRNIVTSLDMDLQQAAEAAMKDGEGKDRTGAVVAIDIPTGEVLVMVSKPGYNLNDFVPRLSHETAKAIQESGGWLNRAIQGQYPPGSTFKIFTAVAGLRAGSIEPGVSKVICPGFYQVGNRRFPCNARSGHGEVDLVKAIALSCNVFFYKYGLETGPDLIAAEGRRFGLGHPTGIELPAEFRNPRVADPAWKLANMKERWVPGDTANISIGQGDTLVTPLQVACAVAAFARGETETRPTILHDPKRPAQHTTPIGLSPSDYNTILRGMEQCYQLGTGRFARVDGLTGAAKTGTAQKGRIDLAWTVGFAPLENPRIAVAVVLEGEEEDNNFGGGVFAAPVVHAIFAAWKQKSERPPEKPVNFRIE
ncbi:MAG: peptidoglycan glycosyltransferase [Opitutaceae bacterium]|nr:peptidoglycan glycosyltransferase [Opitutaceae bacterium]